MDADDAAAEQASALGATTFCGSQRAAYDMGAVGNTVHIPFGCPGADLSPHPEAVYMAIAQVGAVGGHDVPRHSRGFSPSISGALGAPGAGGDASPSAWSAPRRVHGSQRAAGGADGGALGSPGAGGDASPSAQSTLHTTPGSRRAAGGAAGGALGASRAGGAASPSAQSAPRTVLGGHQAAGGAAGGSNLTPCSSPSFPPAPRLGTIHKSKCGLPPDPPLTLQVAPSSRASAERWRCQIRGQRRQQRGCLCAAVVWQRWLHQQ